jgi:hypothetical protein
LYPVANHPWFVSFFQMAGPVVIPFLNQPCAQGAKAPANSRRSAQCSLEESRQSFEENGARA